MNYCKKCSNYYYGTACNCQPFRCGNEEFSGEDRTRWREYYARDHQDAAEQWAEHYDQDDHSLLESEDATVECEVIASDGTTKKFKVGGEIEISYYAEEMEEIENNT